MISRADGYLSPWYIVRAMHGLMARTFPQVFTRDGSLNFVRTQSHNWILRVQLICLTWITFENNKVTVLVHRSRSDRSLVEYRPKWLILFLMIGSWSKSNLIRMELGYLLTRSGTSEVVFRAEWLRCAVSLRSRCLSVRCHRVFCPANPDHRIDMKTNGTVSKKIPTRIVNRNDP